MTGPLTEANVVQAAEYWWGTTTLPAGQGTPVSSLVTTATTVSADVSTAGVPAGAQQLNLRVKDTAGNWSLPKTVTVNVVLPNAIFSNGFDTGNSPWGWSAASNGLSVSTAAGTAAGGTNRGLVVAMPTTGNRTARFVTDTTPLAEPSYHAKFAFNANTFSAGTAATAAVTVFQATTAAGGQVFALQVHRTGTTEQVRLVLNRSAGNPVTGAWYTLPAGAHTMQVDWVAAASGSLRLLVDGTVRQTLTGNTSSLSIDTVRLGAVAGVGNTTSGTMYFDSFVSTRNTMP